MNLAAASTFRHRFSPAIHSFKADSPLFSSAVGLSPASVSAALRGGVRQTFCHIARRNQLSEFLSVWRRFGIAHHLLNLGITQTGRSFDDDGLLLASCFIFALTFRIIVGVDIESDFDLRYAVAQAEYRRSNAPAICFMKPVCAHLAPHESLPLFIVVRR